MKKVVLVIAVVLMTIYSTVSLAQISVNVNVGNPNRCNAPRQVAYYYLPEIQAYYDTYASVYIYYGPRGWMRSRFLPDYCRGYDTVNGYRVALEYRGDAPFEYFDSHRARYCSRRDYREDYYRRSNCNRNDVVVVYNNHSRKHGDDDDDDDDDRGRNRYHGNKHWRR